MSFAIRPSWSVELPRPSHEVIETLAAELVAGPMHVKRARPPGGGIDRGRRVKDHFLIAAPAAQQRVWSPWLAIDVTPAGEGAHVHAQFSPHPTVWTAFAFGYLTLGLGLVIALIVAAAGAMVPGAGQGWALWLAAGLVAALVGLWGAAQVGQRLGRAQMDEVRGELERALARCAGAPAASDRPA